MQAHHSQLTKQSIFLDLEGLILPQMPQFAGFLGGGFFVFYILRLSLSGWAGCHFGLTCKPLSIFWPRWLLGLSASDCSAHGCSEPPRLSLVGSHATTPALRCI